MQTRINAHVGLGEFVEIRELKQRRLVRNGFIFYQRNSKLSRSVKYANGPKNALRLNQRNAKN